MTAVLLTSNLMCSSQVSGAAAAAGTSCTTVTNPGALVDKVETEKPPLVLIDLTIPKLDIQQLVPRLKSASPAIQIVAFGPHVHENALAAAQQAGCDQVLARGGFFGRLESMLRSYAEAAEGDGP